MREKRILASELFPHVLQADDNPSYSFTAEDFEKLRGEVETVSAQIAGYLAGRGFA
jgi:hypothetical protein